MSLIKDNPMRIRKSGSDSIAFQLETFLKFGQTKPNREK